MPELPEVESLRRQVEKEFVGRTIRTVEVKNTRILKRHSSAKEFRDALTGAKVRAVSRKGKYLILELDNARLLVFHLGMSGHLIKATERRPLDKHTHVILSLSSGSQLRYFDARQFGECFVATSEQFAKYLGHLGIDPVAEQFPWQDFGDLVKEKRTKLKTLLMDQKFIAGLGNIYADEILFTAGLPHDRPSNTLTSSEVRRLSRAVGEVLQEAIRDRGTTLADEEWRDLYDEAGEHQHRLVVYGRAGEPCRRCRTPVSKIRAGGRSHFFCPQCQSS